LFNQICSLRSPRYDPDTVDAPLENALQPVRLDCAENLGDGIKKILGILAFESIEPLFHKRKQEEVTGLQVQ
jgi:hypothetical protein